MQTWKVWTIVGAAVASVISLVLLLLWRHWSKHSHVELDPPVLEGETGRHGRIYSELQKLSSKNYEHFISRQGNHTIKLRKNTHAFKYFDWIENPNLMIDAVENGWGAFAFYYLRSQATPISSKVWNTCTQCGRRGDMEPEIAWEIGNGADYMQSIRLNPGRKFDERSASSFQILQSALPLPGPPLGAHSYPQEAYYEITIVAEGCEHPSHAVSHDLPSEHDNRSQSTSSPFHGQSMAVNRSSSVGKMLHGFKQKTSSDGTPNSEQHDEEPKGEDKKFQSLMSKGLNEFHLLNINNHEGDKSKILAVGLGARLALSDVPATALPGSSLGSVGLYSDGQILLDGLPIDRYGEKHTTAKARFWEATTSTTVGCGYNPKEKRVFFTFNGDIVTSVTSSSQDFMHPLHARIGSNYDATILVNLGQSSFVYPQANERRAPDPGNSRPPNPRLSKSNHPLYEDSGELFSMERLDSHGLVEMEFSPLSSQDLQQHRHLFSEVEADLFEIALEVGRG
ncbi:hypothetical protein O6H91_20G073200 [Diphasiastrum complanatum]|uniref:Uncharacterized protein n=1 Tax=Diphasiastrum complanatum TaxID=34168 RepID=A0ACC2ASS7_DIPCM|nr:hypothetical protein O6H91_20G073200 [Diphasiastrum complanatum]